MRSLVAAFCLALSVATPCAAAIPQRPNIVLVVVDDFAAPMMTVLAGLQSFAAEGRSLTMVVPPALCCPSRASILTGMYAHNHKVVTNEPLSHPDGLAGGAKGFHDNGHEAHALGVLLQAAGYRTALVGKYLNGTALLENRVPPGWDEWFVFHDQVRRSSPPRFTGNHRGVPFEIADHADDVFAARAVDFVAHAAEPFFLYLAPASPHTPFVPAPRHFGLADGVELVRPPSFNEADVGDKSMGVRRLDLLSPNDVLSLDIRARRKIEMMYAVEEGLAQVRDAIAKRGAAERTIVVFTSDNGFFDRGEHRIPTGKNRPYVEATEVPLVFVGPGIRAGSTSRKLVLNNDLLPTFLELAGAAVPAHVDGTSLRPILEGRRNAWRDVVLLEHWTVKGKVDWFGARSQSLKLVHFKNGECEGYDLRDDPFELESSCRRDRPQVVRLSPRIEPLRICAGASCRTAEGFAP
jgi:arylsulfatase A-like enzyme